MIYRAPNRQLRDVHSNSTATQMRTLIIYVARLLLGTASTLVFLIAVPIVVFAFLLALPGPLTDPIGALLWRVDNDLKFSLIRKIFFPLLVIAITFFFWRMEKFSMRQDATKRRYYRRFSLIYLLVLFYCLSILITNISSPIYKKCDAYTQKLNGGLRQFDDKTYRIQICGSGPNDSGNHDHIRLQVFNSADSLQAIRYFRIDWDFSLDNSLKYDADGIQYLDFSSDELDQRLYMPPSVLDWVRARIPLLD